MILHLCHEFPSYTIENIGHWTLRQFFAAQDYLTKKQAKEQWSLSMAMRAAFHYGKDDFERYMDALQDAADIEDETEALTATNAETFGMKVVKDG